MVNHCKPHCDLSKTRLTYLQQRLQKNKEIMKKYDDIIEEQLQAGIVEHVSTENENHINNPKIHYLPHHAVVREDKTTTKVRILLKRSAKLDPEELSINECLERGPNVSMYMNSTQTPRSYSDSLTDGKM